MDVLLYPSCKLYANGRFRLPNSIKAELLRKRYQRVVILADSSPCCLLLPVSIWEKNKQALNLNPGLRYPKRPQDISHTHLHLYPALYEYLQKPEKIYVGFSQNICYILNEKEYKKRNRQQEKLLENLYENL